jgi:histidyl-tRNA synthetase
MSGPQPLRGMNDVLPDAIELWQHVEAVARDVFAAYGYGEIRVPLLERTELFRRSIGEVTDIVEKEMYTFDDKSGDSVTLRPEATAGIVRAGISNGLLHNQQQKLWCMGPMFRYERPQKGRYRQFHQIDVEALGFAGPDVDAEMILMSARIWRELGVEGVWLELNTLGTPESRNRYRDELVNYFGAHEAALDDDSRRRLTTNPLRILDSKNPEMRGLIEAAPTFSEYLDEESARHFEALQTLLDDAGIAYRLNPRLVRGLDYYTRTVFEWVTDRLGAQGAVCSGGRYDGLVELLGGRPTPAIGWAIGVERLVELLRVQGTLDLPPPLDAYLVVGGEALTRPAFRLAEGLRDALPGLRLAVHCGGGSFKSQMKRADRTGARLALILGEDEADAGTVAIKPLRERETGQQTVPWADAPAAIRAALERTPGQRDDTRGD